MTEKENHLRVLNEINGDLNERIDDLLTQYTDLVEWLIRKHPNVATEYYKDE